MDNRDRLKIAYKKLKAAVFFDKTLLPLRDQLVQDEEQIEAKLDQLENALFDGILWEETKREILESIGVLSFPKKLESVGEDTAIFNSDSIPIKMEKPQYFIDLSPLGHILGTLWVLEFGIKLDKDAEEGDDTYEGMYPHSYGNRLRKRIINEETGHYTYAPGLFEPYFKPYQNWRDNALERTKERLNDKQDALILTLDFKNFYYSVDIRRSLFDGFILKLGIKDEWMIRLNDLIFCIIEEYARKLRIVHKDSENDKGLKLGKRNGLPIGFLPSNILSNVILTPFDKAIIEKWNPVYYGRYVDDIMIVDKVETNSEIYKQARLKDSEIRLKAKDIMKKYLMGAGIMGCRGEKEDKSKGKSDDGVKGKGKNATYYVSNAHLHEGQHDITVQNEKVKLFYFQSGATKALLTCFRNKIKENASEFRMLPEMDAVIRYKNYGELFRIKNEESINKFRAVTGIELDKFALSKFLGKYRVIGELIQDREEDAFAKNALMIFDERALVENYSAWERLFEIFVVNDRIDIVEKLAVRIIRALERYEVPETICGEDVATHDGMLRTLRAALCRAMALVWGEKCAHLMDKVHKEINKLENPTKYAAETLKSFKPDCMLESRRAYCATRMVNKYVMPLPIDCFIDKNNQMAFSDEQEFCLASLAKDKQLIYNDWHKDQNQYVYYPYVFLPQDISFALTYEKIYAGENLPEPKKLFDRVKKLFLDLNYPLVESDREIYNLSCIAVGHIERFLDAGNTATRVFGTHIDCGKEDRKERLSVAVGNAILSERDVRNALDLKPNRSYQRYTALRKMIDDAIENQVHMLVLPESYLPLEWLPVVSRICANNQLALITGVEHIPVQNGDPRNTRGMVYNLIAVILPYKVGEYSFAHVTFHNKVEYSPEERSFIRGCRYEPHEGDSYQLFCWKDIWFGVYCCYELTSIRDRALFQTYADMIVAVEWNKDVSYFSNIVESLSRDLHCYCIQANSSDYGDSRVVRPTETVQRDVIKTKGGKNTGILYDEIDIKGLRDFQMKSGEQQKKEGTFKQTPPNFDLQILEKKRNGTLKEVIRAEEQDFPRVSDSVSTEELGK